MTSAGLEKGTNNKLIKTPSKIFLASVMSGGFGPDVWERFRGKIDLYFTTPDCRHFDAESPQHGEMWCLTGSDSHDVTCEYKVGCRLSYSDKGVLWRTTRTCNASCPGYEGRKTE